MVRRISTAAATPASSAGAPDASDQPAASGTPAPLSPTSVIGGPSTQAVIPMAAGASAAAPLPPTPNKPMDFFTAPIPAGVTIPVSIAGNRFFVLKCTGTVMIKQSGGDYLPYVAGQGMRLHNSQFTRLFMQNPSTTSAVTVAMAIGFDDYQNFSAPPLLANVAEGLTLIINTGVVQAISALDVFFTAGFLYGYNALAAGTAVNNANTVAIGKSKTYLPDIITQGEADWPILAPPGRMFNLANWFMLGTAADGLFWSVVL